MRSSTQTCSLLLPMRASTEATFAGEKCLTKKAPWADHEFQFKSGISATITAACAAIVRLSNSEKRQTKGIDERNFLISQAVLIPYSIEEEPQNVDMVKQHGKLEAPKTSLWTDCAWMRAKHRVVCWMCHHPCAPTWSQNLSPFACSSCN